MEQIKFYFLYPNIRYKTPITNGTIIGPPPNPSPVTRDKTKPINIEIVIKNPPIFSFFQPQAKPINTNGKTINQRLSKNV